MAPDATISWGKGAARQTKKEFVQFLHIARGSASEIDTQLEVAHRLNYIGDEVKRAVDARLDAIGRMLTGLIRSVRGRDS